MSYDLAMNGTLYLVATPIGNLGDITTRALETLRAVDFIACEDTRQTRKLLTHFGISAKLISYHEHNEQQRSAEFVKLLLDGKNIAVVSDAGTPGVADPSFRAVQTAIAQNVKIVPIPGAAAFVNALIVSGLPTDTFFFQGFLPSRATERRKRLRSVANVEATLIFYESPRRLAKSLIDCLEILGNRKAVVARELTKIYEEVVRADLNELGKRFAETEARGEVVLLVGQPEAADLKSDAAISQTIGQKVAELEAAGFDHRAALKQAAREFGLPRSEAYRRLLAERG